MRSYLFASVAIVLVSSFGSFGCSSKSADPSAKEDVGGYPIPEVNRLMYAFMEGAREVNPKVKFSVSFIGSWFDPPKAKEAAFAVSGAM